jgi:hypothetical protein
MEAVSSFATLVSTNESTRSYKLGDQYSQLRRRQNLNYRKNI